MSQHIGRLMVPALTVLSLIVPALAGSIHDINSAAASKPPRPVSKRVPKRLEPEYAPGEILVRYKPGAHKSKPGALAASMRGQTMRRYRNVPGLERIRLPKAVTVKDAIAAYGRDPDVLYVEPNYRYTPDTIPDDPRFNELWALHNSGQTGGSVDADINADEAWSSGFVGDADIVVAVIDSGIDYTHEDLSANVWTNPGEVPGNGLDDDGNGYIDDVHGIDAVNGDADPMDDHGHGTHVAGIIAASGNNGKGIVGVTWNTKIMACKFLDANNIGFSSDAIECLNYILALKTRALNPVDIVVSNNSWGGVAYSQALHDAIAAQRDAGILYVAAAGNNTSDNDTYPYYPASFQLSNIISVAATDHQDTLAWFSNIGRRTVHVGAPGQRP